MPRLGLGTGLLRNAPGQASMELALSLRFRHLDTAEMYTNEGTVGAAIAASGVPRGDIHITTKMLPEHMEPAELRRSMERSLAALKTDYVDLHLIHWHMPDTDLGKTLAAMMRLQEEGYARAIGVCNFNVALLRQAVEVIGAPIACNQVEYHVLLDQSAVLRYARSKEIAVIAYAPLARGRFLASPEMQRIARRAWRLAGASWAEVVVGPGRCSRHSARGTPGKPAGESGRVAADAGRRRPRGHCAAAEGSACGQCRLGAGLGFAGAAQLTVVSSSAALMTGGPFAKRRRRRLAET